jgi:hypothetical protein
MTTPGAGASMTLRPCAWPDGGCAYQRTYRRITRPASKRQYQAPTGIRPCPFCGTQRRTITIEYREGDREWISACIGAGGCDTLGFWLDEGPG